MTFLWWLLSVLMLMVLAFLYTVRAMLGFIQRNMDRTEEFKAFTAWQQFKMFQDLQKVRNHLFLWSIPVFIILCFAVGGVAAS